MSIDPGDRLADELAELLVAGTQRRRRVPDLMGLVVQLRPELSVAVERYQRLAEVIERLAERDVVRTSKGRRVVQGVDLPVSVEVRALITQPRPENPALRFPWVEEMRWAAAGPRRPSQQFERLCCLSEWIARNRGRPAVPERERSLEIFGEDKVLGAVVGGLLRGRVATIEALSIERCHPPMAVAAVEGATGRAALIVENGTPFHSALAAARRHIASGVPVDIRWIGYGAGEQLSAIVPSLAELHPSAIRYFGDLDPAGLSFAAAGARRCEVEGLPPLEPAHWLYDTLLERGRPQRKPHPTGWSDDGLAWLGDQLASRLQASLAPGEWLAQEWIGVEILTAETAWCTVGNGFASRT